MQDFKNCMGMVKDIFKNERNSRFQTISAALLIAFIILMTSGFKCIYWNSTYAGWFRNIILFGSLIYLICNKTKGQQYHFRQEVIFMMFLPFLSIINSSMIYSQSIFHSFVILITQFTWVLYFLLHKYRVQEETILRVFLYVSLFIVMVQIIQQFTYPNAPFGTKSASVMLETGAAEAADQRNGLWRFRMNENAFFTAPILFALWSKVKSKMSAKQVFFILLLLVSVYLTLTRQVMIACILAIFFSMFMGKKKMNLTALILGLLLIGGLYVYYDVLFSSLAEQTKNDSDEDNVRLLAAAEFWAESIKSPLTFLFGYGLPDATSAYGAHMMQLRLFYGFYTSDIGFIGQIFERGFLYVFVCYYMLYKLFFKLKKIVPLYIRMFVVFTGAMSIMIFPCISPAQTIVWALLLYICDLHINKSVLAINS